jgi:hypothetical protein
LPNQSRIRAAFAPNTEYRIPTERYTKLAPISKMSE